MALIHTSTPSPGQGVQRREPGQPQEAAREPAGDPQGLELRVGRQGAVASKEANELFTLENEYFRTCLEMTCNIWHTFCKFRYTKCREIPTKIYQN